MKRSLKELTHFRVETKDKAKGHVQDFLFDEKLWIIRYLKTDFGNLFSSKEVLLPRVFLESPSWDNSLFPLTISKTEIEKCPATEEHLPVSRKYEEELYTHYDLEPYWYSAYAAPIVGTFYQPRPIPIPAKTIKEDDIDTILRSFKEVEGYDVQALDGKLGHIEDILIDDEDWQIVYAVVDTSNWLPWSKRVLISIGWMDKISYVDRLVNIRLYSEAIKNAPEYEHPGQLDENYETGLLDYYSQSLIK